MKAIAFILYLLAFLIFFWTESENSLLRSFPFYIVLRGTIASITSMYLPTERFIIFSESQWEKIEDGYILEIKYSAHGLGAAPSIVVIELRNKSYEEV